jgi:hypothetical protein
MKKIKLGMGVFLSLRSLPLFAADLMPAGMQNLADGILEIFKSDFVKVILAVFLCGSAVAYAFNKDNEKVKRSAIAIGVGAAIIMAASGIVGAVWQAAQ